MTTATDDNHQIARSESVIMKRILEGLGCLFFILFISATSYAKEWRGIIPFHSTRADVEKLLGEPPPPPKDGTRIYTPSKRRSLMKEKFS